MNSNPFFKSDFLNAAQFTKADVQLVLETAVKMRDVVKKDGSIDLLKGSIMTALFYEPGSRTFGSFIAAMQRLGGGIIPLHGVVYSSVAKGESLSDTVKTFSSYSDVIVIRYPHVGGAQTAADATEVPIINAGDGNGEHPTQALLDTFTVTERMGNIDGKTITLVGDLLNGRTVHSLVQLLSLYKPATIHCISPKELSIPREFIELLEKRSIRHDESDVLDDVLPETDVLYVTRVQKERFRDLDVYEKLKHRYIITPDLMSHLKKTAILMHPFPRVGEITEAVDTDPRAVYLTEQMRNGMYIRMAILALVLKEKLP